MAHSVLRYHYFTRYVLSVINFIVLPPPSPLPIPLPIPRCHRFLGLPRNRFEALRLLANKPEPVNRFSAIPDGKRIEEKSWHRSRSQLFRESSFLRGLVAPELDTILRKFPRSLIFLLTYDFVLGVIIVIFFSLKLKITVGRNFCFDEKNLDADEIIYHRCRNSRIIDHYLF